MHFLKFHRHMAVLLVVSAIVGSFLVYQSRQTVSYIEQTMSGKVLGTGTAPVISNIQVTNITTTSATVTWTADEPATHQLIISDNLGMPIWRTPEPRTSQLSTSYAANLTNLVPGKKYYVWPTAIDAEGNANPYPDIINNSTSINQFTTFTTPPIDSGLPYNYRLDINGPKNVYAGSDLYFSIDVVQLSGPAAAPDFYAGKAVNGLPSGVTYAADCWATTQSTVTPSYSCYGGGNKRFSGIFRVGPSVAPGTYTANITTEAGGVQKQFSYVFTVQAAPGPVVKQSVSSIPPIPGLARWESTMISLGNKWCDPNKVYSRGVYYDAWFYDGGRAYLQMADYTRDFSWVVCARYILDQYRTWALTVPLQPFSIFPAGLAMHYWRFGDDASRQAVVTLYNKSNAYSLNGASAAWGLITDPYLTRELAYGIDSLIIGEQVGQPRSPYLARAVDGGLAIFDQLYKSDTKKFNQPFMGGLMSEALISYYELTGDNRIPPTIKLMLDWLWDNGVDKTNGSITYNPIMVPGYNLHELNNLIIPAYAWYWNITGDDTYRQRGDFLFEHALDDDLTFSGKLFSQNYKWSFDYVRWRQGLQHGTTYPASNPPYVADTLVPVVSGVFVSGVSSDRAVISWTTNEPASTEIEYGPTVSYGSASIPLTLKTTSHTQGIFGLAANTTYHFRVKSSDGAGNVAVSSDYSFTTTASPASDSSFNPIRINSGGSQYTDSTGVVWNADAGYTGGIAYTNTNTIKNSPDITLYKLQREGGTSSIFSYQFSVPNGTYYVNMKFGELYYSNIANRIFDVAVNGQTVFPRLDIVKEAGGGQRALDKSAVVVVTNGTVSAEFISVFHAPTVSAIEIAKIPPNSTGSGPPVPTNPTSQNLASGIIPTSSLPFDTTQGSASAVTDGVTTASLYARLGAGPQWVQLDLGQSYALTSVKLWHYYTDSRRYKDVIVQLSNDPSFQSSVTTVFNNDTDNSAGRGAGSDAEYTESASGKTISFNAVTARYVRHWINGSSANTSNHFVEMEVYGTAVSAPPPTASNIQRKLVISPEGLPSKAVSGTAYFLHPSTKVAVGQVSFTTASNGETTITVPAGIPQNSLIKIVVPAYLSRILSSPDLTNTSVVTLTVPTLYAGDFNSDGLINSLDYSSLNAKWNQTASLGTLDINRDGLINSLDYAVLKNNWNRVGEQ